MVAMDVVLQTREEDSITRIHEKSRLVAWRRESRLDGSEEVK